MAEVSRHYGSVNQQRLVAAAISLQQGDVMHLDQKLVDAAIAQAIERFPTGYAGAAAVYTAEGDILTSVFFDSPNETANLCHEAGAYCEAFRRNTPVTASVCVSREAPEDAFVILTPCGICQERLATWGLEVEVAVPSETDPTQWEARTLREVHPYYWRKPWLDTDDSKKPPG